MSDVRPTIDIDGKQLRVGDKVIRVEGNDDKTNGMYKGKLYTIQTIKIENRIRLKEAIDEAYYKSVFFRKVESHSKGSPHWL